MTTKTIDFEEMAEAYGIPAGAIEAYCDDNYIETEEALSEYSGHMIDSFVDWYEDGLTGFAEELFEMHRDEAGPAGEFLATYFDLDRYVNDLHCEGYFSTDGFVFRPA